MNYIDKAYKSNIILLNLREEYGNHDISFKIIEDNGKYDIILQNDNLNYQDSYSRYFHKYFVTKNEEIIGLGFENDKQNLIIYKNYYSIHANTSFYNVSKFLLINDVIYGYGNDMNNELFIIYKNNYSDKYDQQIVNLQNITRIMDVIQLDDDKIGVLNENDDFVIFSINYELIKNNTKSKITLKNYCTISDFYFDYDKPKFLINNKLISFMHNRIMITHIYKDEVKEIITQKIIYEILNLDNKHIILIYENHEAKFKFDFEIISVIDLENFNQKNISYIYDIFFDFE